MENSAFQQLLLNDLKELKDFNKVVEKRLDTTCTTLTEVKTTQANYLENQKNEVSKKIKVLGLIIGVPTILIQLYQFGGFITQ